MIPAEVPREFDALRAEGWCITYYDRVMSSRSRLTRWSGVLAIPLVVAALAGCGDDSKDVAKDPATTGSTGSASPSSSSSASGLPACGDIWKAGGRIPSGYRGCVDNGTTVKADRRPCASGQVLVTYAGTYYGVVGGPVNPVPAGLQKSPKFRSAKQACS